VRNHLLIINAPSNQTYHLEIHN